jgi:hypothetical protein
MADYNSSLPVRTETDGDVVSKIVGKASGEVAEVNTADELLVHDADVKTAVEAVTTELQGGIDVTLATGASVEITDGTETLAINTDGSINVVVADGVSGGEVHEYDTVASAVPATPETVIDYTVTTGKTLQLKAVQVASSAKAKFEVKAGTASAETTRAVGFISTAKGSEEITFPQPIEVVAGDKVLVIVTNLDKANADVYAFINGNEI